MCSTEFTVHSDGLSANSTGLSAKSDDIRWLGISLFIFSIKWISVGFYQILPNSTGFFLKADEIGGTRFFSVRWFFKHYRG
jgi:hypothetical protein